MTVVAGFSPRWPAPEICVAERRLSRGTCRVAMRRSATKLKRLSMSRVRSNESGRPPGLNAALLCRRISTTPKRARVAALRIFVFRDSFSSVSILGF